MARSDSLGFLLSHFSPEKDELLSRGERRGCLSGGKMPASYLYTNLWITQTFCILCIKTIADWQPE